MSNQLLVKILEDLSASSQRLEVRLSMIEARLAEAQRELHVLHGKLNAAATEAKRSKAEIDEHFDVTIIEEDDLPPIETLPQLPADLGPSDPQEALPSPDELAAILNAIWKDK